MDKQYGFRRVANDDLPLINEWQQRPHVAPRWDAATPYTPEDVEDQRLALWFVELERRPIAFIQDYSVHAWGEHPFAYLPPLSRGIDQFIAEPELLGQGHGRAFIKAHLKRLFAASVPVVGTDPHPANARAIAAYRKAGFEVVSGEVETDWGRSVLMECVSTEPSDIELLKRLYDRLNARDMEAALAVMHGDVVWANGLDGGHVCGHEGVRDYWTRQWATIDARAEPIGFSIDENGTVNVEVHLSAHDLDGKLLFDKIGRHVFQVDGGLIKRFDIH
jgi:aminoglycoside 6'-N-acetyltransferase